MKAAFYTLGCKVNQYESEYMAERDQLVENSMGGSTKVNPIAVEKSQMYKFVDTVYYGI